MHPGTLAPDTGATPAVVTVPPAPARRNPLVAMVAVAYALRVIAIFVTKSYLFPAPFPVRQAIKQGWYFGYEVGRVARSIAAGHGFGSPFHGWTGPSAWLAPVYPYLLAGVFRVFGIYTPASGVVILSLNCVFAALTCVPIFHIAKRLFGRRIALWSAWLWAVVPLFFTVPVQWAWETSLSTLMFCLVLLLTLRLEDSPGWKSWFGWGVLWGAIALTNPSLLSLMPFALLWGWWHRPASQPTSVPSTPLRAGTGGKMWGTVKTSLPAAIGVMACVLTMSPWLARNHSVFGQWIFVRSNFGAELRFGNAEQATGVWLGWMHPTINDVELVRYGQVGELAYVAQKKSEAIEFIRRRPGFFLDLTVRRFFMYWCNVPPSLSDATSGEVLREDWPTICFAALAFLGLAQMLRRKRGQAWFLAPALLVYPTLYYITYPHPRYRHPIEPLMLMLAVYVVSEAKIRTAVASGIERGKA
jgi:Dolichyl-phosphate-mannose-protein mannosyltransferase